ncbi:hypothetical protein H2203_008359 [Taxawa tesnikishii (nom. ined.)]|nr:hypothetical protein H2203_008359 [Dothideales sp. JES 119]
MPIPSLPGDILYIIAGFLAEISTQSNATEGSESGAVSLAPYAALSPDWQAGIETYTFKRLSIQTTDRLRSLRTIVRGRRRHAVQRIDFTMSMETSSGERSCVYVLGRNRFAPQDAQLQEMYAANRDFLLTHLRELFQTLQAWTSGPSYDDDGLVGKGGICLHVHACRPGGELAAWRLRHNQVSLHRLQQYLPWSGARNDESLPHVPAITALNVYGFCGHRFACTSIWDLASSLPCLEHVGWEGPDDTQKR